MICSRIRLAREQFPHILGERPSASQATCVLGHEALQTLLCNPASANPYRQRHLGVGNLRFHVKRFDWSVVLLCLRPRVG